MRRWIAALSLAAIPTQVDATFELRFERLEAAALTLHDVVVRAQRLDGGRAEVAIGRAALSGKVFRQIRLDCDEFRAVPALICRGGRVRAKGWGPWPLEFALRGPERNLSAHIGIARDLRIDVAGTLGGARPSIVLRADAVDLSALGHLLSAESAHLAAYAPHGRADIRVDLDGFGAGRLPSMRLQTRLSGVGFATADGFRAAENLSLHISARVQNMADPGPVGVSLDWADGELLWDGVYLKGGGSSLNADVALVDTALQVRNGTLDLAEVGRLQFDGAASFEPPTLERLSVSGNAFDLAALNERFIAPFLSARALPPLLLSGRADVEVDVDRDGAKRAYIALTDAAIADSGGRWQMQGVDAELPWLRDASSVQRIRVAGARFGRIPTGAFALRSAHAPGRVSVEPVRIPLLDAGLRLNLLEFVREDGRWHGDLSVDLEPVSMPELSEALGLPRMAGSLGASVPHVTWRDGVLALDGQMLIQVFDGYIAATGLKVVEPFGGAPRVLADLQMRYIDLEALTATVQFGRITGRLDGDVSGLELFHWQPVAFDAHIRSSEGDYPRVISQRAVQNITALGGPGAAAAIQRSFLGFFERFGYRRIGLSCVLRDEVCDMDGLQRRGDGFVLIEGGGLPALNVVGYNRRVDWPELLSRLSRVTDAEPVVK